MQKASPKRLHHFYIRHGCRQKELIDQRLKQIAQAKPLTQDPAILCAHPLMVQSKAELLRTLFPKIEKLEQEIKKLFQTHPDKDLFDLLPGAGAVLAPRLLAALGTDRSRFQSAQQLEQFSGIAPVIKRSGKSFLVHYRVACAKFLRQTFHQFAACSIRFCGGARAVYNQPRSRGKSHHVAVRAVAYKWIRLRGTMVVPFS